MGTLAPKPTEPAPPPTEHEIRDQVLYWHQHLTEALAGSNMPTEAECRTQLDVWLLALAPYTDPRDYA
jgi:hypothetical protein